MWKIIWQKEGKYFYTMYKKIKNVKMSKHFFVIGPILMLDFVLFCFVLFVWSSSALTTINIITVLLRD